MKNNLRKPIVLISGVNLNEGGPLSILADAVKTFVSDYISEYRLVLLVHNKDLFKNLCNNTEIEIYEYAYPKKSWLLKIWFEYVHCWFISKKINPFLWFSIHDVTPNVVTKNKVVYCHNPAPFYHLSFEEAWKEKTLFFFHFFYSILYRINIKKNKYVIVQQQWLREEFIKRYNMTNVVVAYPDIHAPSGIQKFSEENKIFRFCYPALPRVFKNFEVIFKAVTLLEKQYSNFEVILTFNGSENAYASQLIKQNNHSPHIKFIGLQSREKIWQLYNECSCLIFPSKMETWGLPITETKFYNKPMLVANCRYAHETVGNYWKACFFDVDDAVKLSYLMQQAINGSLNFDSPVYNQPAQPFVQSWKELFNLILSDE